MSTDPVTVTTTHDTPLFDPEDHRAPAAEQLGFAPDEIHCIGCGPDEFTTVQEPVYSEDGTLLKGRVVTYGRRTTWEPRPRAVRDNRESRVTAPEIEHHIPQLSRGARWHGIKDGTEGNYISTGDDLVLLDSPEGLKVLSAMHAESVANQSPSASPSVG